MTSPTYDTATVARLRALVKDCASWAEAKNKLVEAIGSHPDNVTRMNRRHGFWAAGGNPAAGKPTTEDELSVEATQAATMDEVMELCEIDSALWEGKGFNVRQTAKGLAWSARFSRRKEPFNAERFVAAFVRAAKEHAPRKWAIEKAAAKGADCLYVLNLQDLHLAKLAHHAETGGADWDIKIAERAFRQAVKELLGKAPVARIEEVVVIVGSDMLQIDTDHSTTTAGTYVDSDSRLSKVFDTATKMLADVIEEIASRFKVRVVVIPGNHDSVTSHMLGRWVEAWFHANPNVTVDGSPTSRKYIGYGATLVAFDHGNGTKLKDLPLVVMRENQRTISQYRFIEVLTGHRHIEASEDMKGIVVRTAPALCSQDRWHSDQGYIGTNRRSQGLLYQRANGLEAIYYSTALD